MVVGVVSLLHTDIQGSSSVQRLQLQLLPLQPHGGCSVSGVGGGVVRGCGHLMPRHGGTGVTCASHEQGPLTVQDPGAEVLQASGSLFLILGRTELVRARALPAPQRHLCSPQVSRHQAP